MAVRNFTHGQLKIIDGASREKLVLLDEGNLTFTERKEAKVIMSRGQTKEFAEGVQEAIPIAFTTHFSDYFSLDRTSVVDSDVSLRDFLSGDYTGAQSTSTCGPYTTKLQFTLSAVCAAGSGDKNEVLFFDPFHCDEKGFSEEEESNKFSFSGKGLKPVPNNNVPDRTAV